MSATYEEWRIVAKVLDRRDALSAVIDQMRATTPPEVDVHARGHDEIMIYAFTEAEMRSAEQALASIAAREGVTVQTTLTRWNPGGEQWQDPELPIEPMETPLDPEWIAVGDLGWEVRVKAQTRKAARRVENDLRAKGRPLLIDGLRRITVGVANEQEARQLAEEIRWADPLAAIQVRPLSGWRRWRIREAVLGGYAAGDLGGAGWGGDVGGGSGGFD
ncbi:MAG TPA: hypothetical protein VF877_09910 [Gaiellaceae bacterium]